MTERFQGTHVAETTAEFLREHGIEEIEIPDDQLRAGPPSFSLRSEMTAVEDQGSGFSCTTFCVVALLEHAHKRDLSEGHFWHAVEKKYGDCKPTTGVSLGNGMTLALDGIVDERLWVYDDTKPCWPSPPSIGAATKHAFTSWQVVYGNSRAEIVDRMRELVADSSAAPGGGKADRVKAVVGGQKRPVGLDVPVIGDWSGGPDIPMPKAAEIEEWIELQGEDAATASPSPDKAWHCLTITGYDTSKRRLEFKNSWGSAWGNGGYGTIPFDYIDRYSGTAVVGTR
jgi:hypothetical protein